MSEEEQVRADAVFGFSDHEHAPEQLRRLYDEALRQHRQMKVAVDQAQADADRLGWENAALRSDVQKKQAIIDHLHMAAARGWRSQA